MFIDEESCTVIERTFLRYLFWLLCTLILCFSSFILYFCRSFFAPTAVLLRGWVSPTTGQSYTVPPFRYVTFYPTQRWYVPFPALAFLDDLVSLSTVLILLAAAFLAAVALALRVDIIVTLLVVTTFHNSTPSNLFCWHLFLTPL